MSLLRNKKGMPGWPLILLLFTSVDTVLFGTNGNRLFLFVPRVLGVLAIVLLPIISSGSFKTAKIHLRDISLLLLFVAIMTVSGILNKENPETYLSRLIVVILAYSISHSYSKYEFSKTFDVFMTAVSICAVVMELFCYLTPGLVLLLPRVINTAEVQYQTWFFSAIAASNLSQTLIRSSGVFWEPGAFAIYLVFALFIQLFVLKNTNIWKVLLYCLALFLTFSTTGYLAFAVLLLAFIFSPKASQAKKQLKYSFAVLAVLIVVGSVLLDSSLLYDRVFAKLTNGTSSATTRYSSLYNGMRVALDHPFFGVGSNTREYMTAYVLMEDNPFKNGGTSITNTVVGQFASYGLLFGILFLIGTVRYLKSYSRSTGVWLLLVIFVLMTYAGERFFSFFPFVFVFYGLSFEPIVLSVEDGPAAGGEERPNEDRGD